MWLEATILLWKFGCHSSEQFVCGLCSERYFLHKVSHLVTCDGQLSRQIPNIRYQLIFFIGFTVPIPISNWFVQFRFPCICCSDQISDRKFRIRCQTSTQITKGKLDDCSFALQHLKHTKAIASFNWLSASIYLYDLICLCRESKWYCQGPELWDSSDNRSRRICRIGCRRFLCQRARCHSCHRWWDRRFACLQNCSCALWSAVVSFVLVGAFHFMILLMQRLCCSYGRWSLFHNWNPMFLVWEQV